METLVVVNLLDDFRYRVCAHDQSLQPNARIIPHVLKIAPMTVNMIRSEITLNAKYRARVALCKRDLVAEPWYRESRKTIGMKKLSKR